MQPKSNLNRNYQLLLEMLYGRRILENHEFRKKSPTHRNIRRFSRVLRRTSITKRCGSKIELLITDRNIVLSPTRAILCPRPA